MLTDCGTCPANLSKINTKSLGFFVKRCSIDAESFRRGISTPIMLT
jgi:hypothetical protein